MGVVFDIQRCSLQDGPGIRTTVFLKGCPLRCAWCHNPESYERRPQISFRAESCRSCMECAGPCEHGAHETDEAGQHHYARERCVVCGACVPACPNNALALVGQELSVEAVLAEVEADRIFYARSGGGMTLSGGEPLLQFEFTRALLLGARERGIHTCLETCGQAPRERYAELLPLVDLFLFDYKATGAENHRALTGVDGVLIRGNLAFLLDAGASVILRCPLVPGVNDSPDHLRAIAALAQRRPGPLRVEIMPYHSMGNEKALRLGAAPRLAAVQTAGEAVQESWMEQLAQFGCSNCSIS